jgi:hypothetical protein
LKGETGERKDITKGEVMIKTQQAMGVFEGIGRDVEYGGEQAIEMLQDVLTTYWDPGDSPSYMQVLGPKHAQMIQQIMMMTPEQRMQAMQFDTDVEIRGVSLLFAKSELVDRLINMVKVTDSPRFAPYAKDDVLIRKLADAMESSEAIRSDEEMQQIQQQQQEIEQMQQQQMLLNSAVMGGAPTGGPAGQPPAADPTLGHLGPPQPMGAV